MLIAADGDSDGFSGGYGSLRQIGYNTIITNVPGPQVPLYALGCRMVEAFPIAFLYEGQQLATAIFSYAGGVNFGYIADRHAFPHIDRVARCVEDAVAELLDVARASDAGAATAERPAAARRPAARRHAIVNARSAGKRKAG